ncbi:unnamed protein product, partial [Medioppia subpectinata]
MQEGIDLVDALDHLVQNLNRADGHKSGDCPPDDCPPLPLPTTTTAVATGLQPFDVVLMDHNYCQTCDYYSTAGVSDGTVGTAGSNRTSGAAETAGDSQTLIGDQHQPVVGVTTNTTISTTSATKLSPHKQQTTLSVNRSTTSATSAVAVAAPTVATPVAATPPTVASPVATSANSFVSFNDNSSSTMTATSPSPTRVPPDSPLGTPTFSKSSSPKTPPASRRSQRQIDRFEKSMVEKIKAENQEMLKREKEIMESPIKSSSTDTSHPLTPSTASAATTATDETKDTDEDQLVIDFDKKSKEKTIGGNSSNNSGKRNNKRQKSLTNVSVKPMEAQEFIITEFDCVLNAYD